MEIIINILVGITGSMAVAFVGSFGILFTGTLTKILSRFKEKKDEEVADSDSNSETLRAKIEKDKEKEKKQALEEQALALRQKYELLLSENLLNSDGSIITDWRKVLQVSHRRLQNEGKRLLKRNQIYFRNAIFTSLLAISFLIYCAFSNNLVGTNNGLGIFFTNAKLVIFIVLLIEGVSGWFFRRYVVGGREFNINKNEIKTIEFRLTAGLLLSSTTEQPNFTVLADALSKEQHNFVLNENESFEILDASRLLELLPNLPKIGGV